MGAQQHVLRARRKRGPVDRLSGRGRSRLDAQLRVEAVRVDVEGVLSHPRRVPGRVIEGGEVVVVELDLGALHHPVAEADEDVLDLAHGSNQQVARPDRRGRRARQGHVHRVGGQPLLELGRLELRPPAFEQPLQRLASPRCRRCRPAHARSAGSSADPPQDPGQLGLAPQVANPELLERRGVRRRGDRGLGLAAKLARFWPGHQPWPAILRPSSYSATAAAIATLSESGPSGRMRDPARLRRRSATAPAAGPRAPPRRRSRPAARPRARPTAHRRPAVQRQLGCRSARPGPPEPEDARAPIPCSPAPPSGSRDRRSPGPSTTGPVAERVRGADDRPDVAGIADTVEVHREAVGAPGCAQRWR